jgi:hypothetical protein
VYWFGVPVMTVLWPVAFLARIVMVVTNYYKAHSVNPNDKHMDLIFDGSIHHLGVSSAMFNSITNHGINSFVLTYSPGRYPERGDRLYVSEALNNCVVGRSDVFNIADILDNDQYPELQNNQVFVTCSKSHEL